MELHRRQEGQLIDTKGTHKRSYYYLTILRYKYVGKKDIESDVYFYKEYYFIHLLVDSGNEFLGFIFKGQNLVTKSKRLQHGCWRTEQFKFFIILYKINIIEYIMDQQLNLRTPAFVIRIFAQLIQVYCMKEIWGGEAKFIVNNLSQYCPTRCTVQRWDHEPQLQLYGDVR